MAGSEDGAVFTDYCLAAAIGVRQLFRIMTAIATED